MTFHFETQRSTSGRSRRDVWEYRLAFAATFLVMLLPAAFSWLALSRDEQVQRSIFHEARARADKIVPFMFMG